MARRYYSSTAARTALASSATDIATTMVVDAVTGWPSSFPYTLIIDPDTVNEEIVTVTNRSGTTLTVTRGVDGTSAVAHSSGAVVQHGVSARDFDEPNAFINGTSVVTSEMIAASPAFTGAPSISGATPSLTITDTDNNADARVSASSGNLVLASDINGEEASSIMTFNIDGTEFMRLNSVGLLTGPADSSLGAWKDYTPALTGWSLGDGTISAAYCQIGKTVHYRCLITAGSTTTFGSLTVAYPVTMNVSNSGVHIVNFRDASASTNYQGAWSYNSTTICTVRYLSSTFAHTNLSTTAPFAWASGDIVQIAGTYEAA